jgi:formylglycine-generating enzyme required for sulfatase activity
MAGARGVALVLSLGAAVLFGQEPGYKNTIGMEFALIQPGSMLVGKYEPGCPVPGGGRGGGGGGGRAALPGGGAPGAPGAAAGRNPVPGGGRGGGRGPADPRNQWTEKDYADCQEMAKKASLPGFTVKIAKQFYMGTTEVTQGQWKKVMGTNPSFFQGDKVKDDADLHPVDSVTWADAQAFVKKLNALEKTKVYRLPTEFEWEYAARAGSDKEVAGYRDYSWTGENNKPTSHAVAGKKPNAWGLYDMIGNVWEWVADYYNEKFFPDPAPPKSGKEHVLRGASFIGDVHNASVFTHGAGPGNGWDVGFRIAREVK